MPNDLYGPLIMLAGNKIKIEAFSLSDITFEYLEWLNDLEVTKYSNQRFIKHTYDSCTSYLESFKNSTNLFLSIRTIKESIFIGTITVYINRNHGVGDIGIMIGNKNFWGKGIAKEVYKLVINYLFLKIGVRKVTSGAIETNRAMIAVMECSGMHLEAVKKSHEIIDGNIVDIYYYAIFR